jgi:heme exporter protein A
MPHMSAGLERAIGAQEPLRLEVDGLACRRGGRLVFEGLRLACAPGGAILVRGPNGAGKSSLLRILAGLLAPADGRLSNPFTTAYLGHDNALKPAIRLEQELGFWARLDGCGSGAVAEALARFELAGLAELPVRLLSAGQKRRAALARLWMQGAALWLLDEPTVGLAASAVERLAATMTEHRAAGGLVIAATHVPLRLEHAEELKLG